MSRNFPRWVWPTMAILTIHTAASASVIKMKTLDEALEACAQHNLDIQLARLDVKIAKQEIMGGLYPFDPELTLSYSKIWNETLPNVNYDRTSYSEITEGPSIGLQKTFDLGTEFEVSLQNVSIQSESTQALSLHRKQAAGQIKITQPLLKEFGEQTQDLKRRKALAQARSYLARLKDTQNKECYDMLNSLLSYSFYQEQLRIEKADLQYALEILASNQAKLKRGTKNRIDYLETLAKVEKKKAKVAEVERDILREMNKVKNFISALPDDQLIFPENWPIKLTSSQPVNLSTKKLVSANKIRDLQNQKLEEKQQWLKDRQDLLPQLDLEFEYLSSGLKSKSSDALEEVLKLKYISWSVALNFTWPWGNDSAEGAYQSSRSKVLSKHHDLIKQVSKVKSDATSILAQYQEEEAKMRKISERLQILDQLAKAKHELYMAQLISSLDLLEAQQNKINLEESYFETKKSLLLLNLDAQRNLNLLIP